MKVKVENVKDKANEVKLEFTVEAEKFDEAIQTVYKKLDNIAFGFHAWNAIKKMLILQRCSGKYVG